MTTALSRRQILALSAATLAAPAFARDDAYPSRPIHVVFPYPPGSPLDALGRVIAEYMARTLGQPVVFDNKPGANGIIGQTQVARATPDGYTLLLTSTSAFLLNSVVRKDLAYDPERSFSSITLLAKSPIFLIVHPSVPAKNVQEFIAYAKANPDKLSFATTGHGSSFHLATEQFTQHTGIKMVHVPYKGMGAAVVDLLSGNVQVALDVSTLAQVRDGKLKALINVGPTNPKEFSEVTSTTDTLKPLAQATGGDARHHFILSRYSPECPFCPAGGPTETIEVFADQPVGATQLMVTIEGVFNVQGNMDAGLFYRLFHAKTVS